MSTAAYVKVINISTDNSNWTELPTTSSSLDFGADVLEDTQTSLNAGSKTRCLGLHDWSIPVEAIAIAGSTVLATVRNAALNRSPLYVQYLPTGLVADGYQGPVVVESYNQSGAVSDLETVSISLQGNGPLAVAV